jgi:endoglucanase
VIELTPRRANNAPSHARELGAVIIALIGLCALLACLVTARVSSARATVPDAFALNELLARGMNLGNALDAPKEGAWGVTLKEEYFRSIKDAGFTSVRIPIRWSAHAQSDPPYAIDQAFFKRVDWAIDQALSHNLAAVVNVHHYMDMDANPTANAPRLLALWKQIAVRYRNRPQTLFFELFNEPHDQLTDQRWSEIAPDLLRVVRASNPRRMVIIGAADFNNLDHLEQSPLPRDDRRLIATFHYYRPFRFTHQGATWIPDSESWKGTTWGTQEEREELREDFKKTASWARRHGRPIYLGEFGTIDQAGMEWRALWTRAVAREAEQMGFSWSYWEFCSRFGAYDPEADAWRQPLLQALLNK